MDPRVSRISVTLSGRSTGLVNLRVPALAPRGSLEVCLQSRCRQESRYSTTDRFDQSAARAGNGRSLLGHCRAGWDSPFWSGFAFSGNIRALAGTCRHSHLLRRRRAMSGLADPLQAILVWWPTRTAPGDSKAEIGSTAPLSFRVSLHRFKCSAWGRFVADALRDGLRAES